MLKNQLSALRKEAEEKMISAQSVTQLYELKVQFLGKNGTLSTLMKGMATLSKEIRPEFGKLANEVKGALEQLYELQSVKLKDREIQQGLQANKMDLTLPGPYCSKGSRHPIQIVMDEIVEILSRIGFSVRSGPLIERDHYNFEALNIPKDHPARDMQDTFYIQDPLSPREYVLRTHTSPVQIRTLETEKPPLRILVPGAVFRRDSDISHSPHFHQIEGLLVDTKVSMSDLRGTIAYFVKAFLGSEMKTRFRPSFFPFTEPSAEVDCSCPMCNQMGCRVCGQTGWVEIGGCGLVHPQVFANVKLDPKDWQGLAFGFGIERMAMIKFGIDNIRLFSENDLRFLEQFHL